MNPRAIALTAAFATTLVFGQTPTAPKTAPKAGPKKASKLELKDGSYFINGQKIFLNAIGYEPGARPGEAPYDKRVSNLAQIREDLKRIKAAGYNGIRTWSEMSDAELKLVQESGLKIVFGIWLKPDENFADPAVVAKDLELVKKTLAYTHKYDCVVTYLIMNEPMPEHLRKVGAQATLELWTKTRDLIHQLHPGVPVTISGNTQITEWVDMNVFDVYGRNAYDYKDGENFTHGFANSQRSIADSFGKGKPVLLTEFGRSVSRAGSGFYGGNTLQEQADAMVKYYRDILDAGAAGACPFYFADGWWKGGNPAVHEDTAEEWFGFVGFKDGKDAKGTERPAWYALKQYNEALVASPKNQQFYQNEVPVEIFAQPDVKKIRVVYLDGVLLEAKPNAKGYYAGKLSFAGEGLKDRELTFESYDAQGRLLKIETLIVLTGKDPIQWPSIELRTPIKDLEGTQDLALDVKIKNGSTFTLSEEVRLAFAAHKGWDRAEARTKKLDPKQPDQTVSDHYAVPADSPMLSIFAGTDVRFGKFVKTIYTQQYLYRGNWADPLRIK